MYGIVDGKLELLDEKDDNSVFDSDSDFDIEKLLKTVYLLTYSKENDKGILHQDFFSKPAQYGGKLFKFDFKVSENDSIIWEDSVILSLTDAHAPWTETFFGIDSIVSYDIRLNDVLVESGIKDVSSDVFDITYHKCTGESLFKTEIEEAPIVTEPDDKLVVVDKDMIDVGAKTKNWELIVDIMEKNGISMEMYTWPLVTEVFCRDIISKAEEYGQWTNNRHDNYPTHDILLKDFGYDEIYNNILNEYAHPTVRYIWSVVGKQWENMVCENFIVKYDNVSDGFQNYLDIHHDLADYTLVLSLNEDYEGGGTWFPRQRILLKKPAGNITLHPILTHRHGARAVVDGIRYVLISFCTKGD
jgi:hypothetical protein